MRWLGRRRNKVMVVALAVALLAVGGLLWFQPQKLLIDERIEEALPSARAPSSTAVANPEARQPTAPVAQPAAVTLAAGAFRSLGHSTAGRAVALELGDGMRFLRLEDLHTSNGPDLFVYLSVTPADGPRDAFDDDFVSLGRLKANQGDQNYRIPAGVDLRRYQSVVVWCRRFTYAFGAAPLR